MPVCNDSVNLSWPNTDFRYCRNACYNSGKPSGILSRHQANFKFHSRATSVLPYCAVVDCCCFVMPLKVKSALGGDRIYPGNRFRSWREMKRFSCSPRVIAADFVNQPCGAHPRMRSPSHHRGLSAVVGGQMHPPLRLNTGNGRIAE